ncbi:hypothetical protein NFC81_15525 [Salinispirillum sp. LH 10-3-1]|uniref:ImmA/IrrE family metallo-endopeptidase n=1 Tax=Salinispirillum sp. LH 10-3-1 TaxID=2952525 RepID=A0AB38YFE6_9GAMM
MYAWNPSWLAERLNPDVWSAECNSLLTALDRHSVRWSLCAQLTAEELASDIRALIDVDAHFERLQSLIDLTHLMNVTVDVAVQEELDTLAHRLLDQSEPLIAYVQSLPSSTVQQPSLKNFAPWIASMRPPPIVVPETVKQTLRQIGSDYYRAQSSLGRQSRQSSVNVEQAAEWLKRRVAVDRHTSNQPWSYQLRCWENDLPVAPVQGADNTDVHDYFLELMRHMGKNRATLQECRHWESERINQCVVTADDALTWCLTVAERANRYGAQVIKNLLQEQRLQLTSDENTIPLCIDTPYGSFVQASFDGSIYSLMSLVHELGHALHHADHRANDGAPIPLSPLECERHAIGFERRFIAEMLQESIPAPLRSALTYYQRYQAIELGLRHAMLHAFESDLYRLPQVSRAHIASLWMQHNRSFYGPSVELNDTFENDWCDVQHLFTAPFYLQLYAQVLGQTHAQ